MQAPEIKKNYSPDELEPQWNPSPDDAYGHVYDCEENEHSTNHTTSQSSSATPVVTKQLPVEEISVNHENTTQFDIEPSTITSMPRDVGRCVYVFFKEGMWTINEHFKLLNCFFDGDGWSIPIEHQQEAYRIADAADLLYTTRSLHPFSSFEESRAGNKLAYSRIKKSEVWEKISELASELGIHNADMEAIVTHEVIATTIREKRLTDTTIGKKILEELIPEYIKLSKRVESAEARELIASIPKPSSSSDKKNNQDQRFASLMENDSEEQLIKEFKESTPSIETGYTLGVINPIPWAFPSGGLSLVCGPTGHGKTTVLINCSLGALKENPNLSMYFFTYEEERKKIDAKFINTHCGLPLNDGDNKSAIYHYFHAQEDESLNPFQYIKYNKELFLEAKDDYFKKYKNTSRLKIRQYDMTTEELVEAIEFIKLNDQNVGLIVVDYVQKLYLGNDNPSARHEAIKEICKKLENCAIKTGLPIVLGAQFTRKIDAEALVSSLGEFSIAEGHDIARTAVNMYGLWNRSHNFGDEKTNEMFVTVNKGRDVGRGHDTVMSFDGNIGKIKNINPTVQPAVRDQPQIKDDQLELIHNQNQPAKSKDRYLKKAFGVRG